MEPYKLSAVRARNSSELRALFAVCSSDRNPTGSRDAADFALLFGAELRRSGAVSIQMEDYDPETGALTVTGKGNRQRIVYATGLAWPPSVSGFRTLVRPNRP